MFCGLSVLLFISLFSTDFSTWKSQLLIGTKKILQIHYVASLPEFML